MPIEMKMRKLDDILFVESWGEDSSLAEVINYQKAIYFKAKEYNINKIICYEMELKYKLGLKDTYKLVRFIKESNPGEIYVAIITQDINYMEAIFFEQLINEAGFKMKFFHKIDNGINWLKAGAKTAEPE